MPIEVSIKTIEGVHFIDKINILEPDDTINGVGVYRVDNYDPELIRGITALGLRKVGFDCSYIADLYARFPIPFVYYRVVGALLRGYWATIRWLYDNVRVFQQIPKGQPFTWTAFTPYQWYKGAKRWVTVWDGGK